MNAEFNKIYVKSDVFIKNNGMPTLCFIDGKAVDRSRFSLTNYELNIYKESLEYLTLSYGDNNADVFYYNVNLNDFGVIIEKYDFYGNWLQGLKHSQILVFIDGRLLGDNEYEIISTDSNELFNWSIVEGLHQNNVTMLKTTFANKVGGYGTFVFSYDGSKWVMEVNDTTQDVANLSDYGIILNAQPIVGNQIIVSYSEEDFIYSVVEISGINQTNTTILRGAFIDKVKKSGRYEFSYDGEKWILNTTQEEFEKLNEFGIDIKDVQPANGNKIIVTYAAERHSAVALKTYIKDDKQHSVIIYSSHYPIIKERFQNFEGGQSKKINYNIDRHLIFKNGYLIPNKNIFSDNQNQSIIINYPIEVYDEILCITLPTGNQTINFTTEKGFLTYGPYDDFGKKVPLCYDSMLTFNDNVVNLIDDIRTGFILRSDQYDSEYLIVDDNFNTKSIKTINIKNPVKSFYAQNEYYLLVPECKKIVDYLGDFDKKGTIIPEILEVFQRFLLDEFHDEIERLRNIRNISKVNSTHINRLLKLLGNKIDLRNKTLQQKRNLLEELTDLYRRVGTYDSYNIFNITDTDMSLVKLEQLFTIKNNKTYNGSKKINIYTPTIIDGGEGYEIGGIYDLVEKNGDQKSANTPIKVTNAVTTPQNGQKMGSIKSVALLAEEDSNNLNLKADTVYRIINTGTEARFNIASTPNQYQYSIDGNIEDPKNALPEGHSAICNVEGFPGDIVLNKKNGKINAELSTTIGETNITLKNADLSFVSHNIEASLSCTTEKDQVIFDQTTPSNTPYEIVLEPGVYYYEMSGGGGSGGSGDSKWGAESDLSSTDGSKGEYLSGILYIEQSSKAQLYVGGGGTPSYARGHGPVYASTPGAGYGAQSASGGVAFRQNGDSIATGAGGGASAIILNGKVKKLAKGGKGGDVTSRHIAGAPTYLGGEGGGGFYSSQSGMGANGGVAAKPREGVKFTSGAGANGWLKLTKAKVKYVVTLNTQIHDNIVQNQKYRTTIFDTNFPSTITITQIDNTNLKNLSVDKIKFVNKLSPQGDMSKKFIYQNNAWSLDGKKINDISEYGIYYDSAPYNGNTVVVNYKYTYRDFEMVIDKYDPISKQIIGFTCTPKDGTNFYSYKNGKILINAESPGVSVPLVFQPIDTPLKINISSQIIGYRYNFGIYTDEENPQLPLNYNVGDILYFSNSSQDYEQIKDFKIYVDQVSLGGVIQDFHFIPSTGKTAINLKAQLAIKNNANGGEVQFSATPQTLDQIDKVREYVDFYNKEELGAVERTEYRLQVQDYGLITEGTTNSPYPWLMGEPDQDYGKIAIDSEIKTITVDESAWLPKQGENTHIAIPPQDGQKTIDINVYWGKRQDKDYGYVYELIKGKWYRWWEWNRDPNYYPTNHVEVVLAPKVGTELDNILERFLSQFYKIASTVLYIHRVIINYNFGNSSQFSNGEDGQVNGALLCGFMTGQPVTFEKYFFTSDPLQWKSIEKIQNK